MGELQLSAAKSQLAEAEGDGRVCRADREGLVTIVMVLLLLFLRVHPETQEKEGLLENQYVTRHVWMNADCQSGCQREIKCN